MVRIALLLGLAGCIAQATASATNAINPPATGGGTLTCRQVMEQCDAQCSDPMCLRRCGDQGNAEAARQHEALFECAQRNACTDEPCIRANCGSEADTCYGEPMPPMSAPEADPPATEPTRSGPPGG